MSICQMNDHYLEELDDITYIDGDRSIHYDEEIAGTVENWAKRLQLPIKSRYSIVSTHSQYQPLHSTQVDM